MITPKRYFVVDEEDEPPIPFYDFDFENSDVPPSRFDRAFRTMKRKDSRYVETARKEQMRKKRESAPPSRYRLAITF
jgi:hypothetical protein